MLAMQHVYSKRSAELEVEMELELEQEVGTVRGSDGKIQVKKRIFQFNQNPR